MSSELVPTGGEQPLDTFESSLLAEQAAERHLMRSIAKAIVIGIPIAIVFFMGLLVVAVGDKTEWYVVVGLGCIIGVIAAALFGMLAGVTLNAHALDEVDHDTMGH
jgi:Na+/melibiose symporter-like transporter